MKFISTGTWRDLSDGHLYREGESFPFDGREIPKERLEELESGRNRAGLRLIRVQDEPEEAPKAEEPEKAPTAPKKAAAPKQAATGKKAATKKTTAK